MTSTDNCPAMASWTTTTFVWNWTGSAWEKKLVPESTYGSEEQVFTDTLPTPPPDTDWSNVADFDQEFFPVTVTNPLYDYWVYVLDYTLDKTMWPLDSAYIKAWSRQLAGTGIKEDCPSVRHFQQRETYTYESVPGYPKGVLTTETIADTPDFITTGYTVMDNDTGAAITPVSGWYLIPAGHSVTIEKQVTTPG